MQYRRTGPHREKYRAGQLADTAPEPGRPANILDINTTQWELRESQSQGRLRVVDKWTAGQQPPSGLTASGHHARDHDRPCVWPYSFPWRLIFGSLDRRGREITAETGLCTPFTRRSSLGVTAKRLATAGRALSSTARSRHAFHPNHGNHTNKLNPRTGLHQKPVPDV